MRRGPALPILGFFPFYVATHMGRGLVFKRSATGLPTQGRGSNALQFLGFFLFMRTPFVAELPNLTMLLRDVLFVGCGSYQFTCNNGRCISRYSRCDGINQCGDFSDETSCGMLRIVCDSFVYSF